VLLALHAPARVAQLQLLVHEAKIASRVELHAGLLPPGASDVSRYESDRPSDAMSRIIMRLDKAFDIPVHSAGGCCLHSMRVRHRC